MGKDTAGPAFICRVSAHPQARPAVRSWAPRRSRFPRARQGQAGRDRSRLCVAAAQLAGRGCVGRLCALWRFGAMSSARANAVGAAVESAEVRGSLTCELRRARTWGMRAPECSLSLRGAGRPGSKRNSAREVLNRPGMSEAAESCTVELNRFGSGLIGRVRQGRECFQRPRVQLPVLHRSCSGGSFGQRFARSD